MPTGRYRVSINGFTCNNQTWDDALNWDGWADEIRISTSVKYMNKNGQTLTQSVTNSAPMGDANNQLGRIPVINIVNKGGGRTEEIRGIITGTIYPHAAPWVRTVPFDVSRNYPPMIIWEGELTQGENIVFITPLIEELDNGRTLWEGLVRWHQETDAKFGQKAKDIFGGKFPIVGTVFDAVSLGIQTIAYNWTGLFGDTATRPVGLYRGLDGKLNVTPPLILPLDYDQAELLIRQNVGRGPGVQELHFRDSAEFGGDYTLYLEVARIDAPVQNPASTNAGIGEGLGGVASSGPAICSWGPGRLDVFVRGQNTALWHIWYENGWAQWEPLDGGLTSNPAAVSWASGRIDVFAKGADNALWHKWYENGWSDWESLGGILTSGPSVCSWGSGRLDVFACGLDNGLWHKWYENGWSDWESLGGDLTSNPSSVSRGSNVIDVVARGKDNSLLHKQYDNGWSDWASLGGILTSGPSVCSWGSGRLDVFARGQDNALWHKSYDSGWSHWESLGGTLTLDPAAVSWGSNRIDVVARGTDNGIWHKYWNGTWSP